MNELVVQHLGHAPLDLAALGLAVTTLATAILVATTLDRRAGREPTANTLTDERTDR